MALPRQYGGHDRSAVDRFIVVEELLRWGAPIGHHWVADRQSGPVIATFGTEQQKQRFLPGICRGELSFSIGMSEPDSGSDLASLSSKATRDGDGWVLEGRKIWTTAAHENDWIIVLCRTTPRDEVDDKREGMTQLIVDLKSPGIEVTPVAFIDGTADFCEVVFDHVFVPDELVLGEVGQGWSQNTSELAYERGGPDRWLSSYLLVEELLRRDIGRTLERVARPARRSGRQLLGAAPALAVGGAVDRPRRSAGDRVVTGQGDGDAIRTGRRHRRAVLRRRAAERSRRVDLRTVARHRRAHATVVHDSGRHERGAAVGGVEGPTSHRGRAMNSADPLLVETIDRLLAEVCPPDEVERAELAGWSKPTWEALVEAGFAWVGVPESAGGSGGTIYDTAALVHAVGRRATPVPLAETAMLGGFCLASVGLRVPNGPLAVVDSPSAVNVADGRIRVDGTVCWARHADRIVLVADDLVCSLRRDQVSVTPGANLAGEARDHVFADLLLERRRARGWRAGRAVAATGGVVACVDGRRGTHVDRPDDGRLHQRTAPIRQAGGDVPGGAAASRHRRPVGGAGADGSRHRACGPSPTNASASPSRRHGSSSTTPSRSALGPPTRRTARWG